MGMKRFTSKMLFLRAADAATCGRNAQKKPGKPGFFDLPLCFGKESGPIGGPGRWGGSAAPSEPLRGPRAPFLQRNKGQTAQPPSPSLAQGEGVFLGSRGGRRHLAAGAKGPGLPNGKPGPGGQRPPGPGFQGAARPRRPPGPQRSRRLKGGRGVERGIAKTGARIKCPCDRAGRNI